MDNTKLLPNDIIAEKLVLASIILEPNNITEVIDIISYKDFYKDIHQFLYKSILEMFNKDIPIEIESICNYVGYEKIKSIGGITYLAEISNVGNTINPKHYAKIVKEKSEKRNIITSCYKAIQKAHEECSSTTEIIDEIENTFIGFSEQDQEKTLNSYELMNIVLDDIERKYKNGGGIPGIKTGFNGLDKATNGYSKGDLWIVAARPSMGKTLFTLNLISKLPKSSNALFFELEMTKEKIGNRLLATESKIKSKMLSRGSINDKDFEKITSGCNYISTKNNIYLNCKPGISLGYIRAEAKKIKLKYGLDVIFIDHLGLIKTNGKGNRSIELGELTSGLKAIAKDLNVCMVVLCQLSRACESRDDKRPLLSDLRESGRIEEDADTVMMLYRDDYYSERENRESDKPNTLEVFIAKNRDGEIGGLNFHCDLENQFIGEVAFGR